MAQDVGGNSLRRTSPIISPNRTLDLLIFVRASGYNILFHGLSSEVAVMLPSHPCTELDFHPAADVPIRQWWAKAKHYAFRVWPYLVNNPTGIFLVTKCIKTKRVAQCLSSADLRGQSSIIHVQGPWSIRRSNPELQDEFTKTGATWQLTKNELEFDILEAERQEEYTVFIERASSRMFYLTGVLKAAAERLWA